jgi:hypothetical protein
MTKASDIAGIPTACSVIKDAGGWQLAEPEAADGSDFQLFTGVLTWKSPEARQEWYEELVRLSGWSYEMFGHKLDALKILAAGGVTASFLEMQKGYY